MSYVQRLLLRFAATFLIALVAIIFFVYLVWRWMEPLNDMQKWLTHRSSSLSLPRSSSGSGLLSPPFEVQALNDALRAHPDARRRALSGADGTEPGRRILRELN